MSLKNTIKLINNHPISSKSIWNTYLKIFKWQVAQFLLRTPMVMPFINDSVLLAEKGMTGATGNIYLGLHEFNDMGFLLHYLNKSDAFFDVGANIGAYTVLASKVCGAKTQAFEPSKYTFERLSNNIYLNRINHLVTAHNLGVSSKSETVNFSKGFDTVNHVTSKELDYTEKIQTVSLNEIIDSGVGVPNLIKIDVEGFEHHVIKGANKLLENSKLNAIIIELNGAGKRYGFSEDNIHLTILRHGFKPYAYDPFTKKFTALSDRNSTDNTLYIKDIDIASKKVNASETFKIMQTQI